MSEKTECGTQIKEKKTTPVLVAWAPEGTDWEEREALRAELEDGIRRGMLVLDRGVSICVLELPLPIPRERPRAEPSGASGEEDEKRPEEREEKTAKCPPMVRARHNPRTAEEKTEIMARLVKFRKDRGLGCFKELSAACGEGVSEDMIRILYTGESPCPIDIWRKVGKALEKLGFQKMGGANRKRWRLMAVDAGLGRAAE